jgi:hypothetical protein
VKERLVNHLGSEKRIEKRYNRSRRIWVESAKAMILISGQIGECP